MFSNFVSKNACVSCFMVYRHTEHYYLVEEVKLCMFCGYKISTTERTISGYCDGGVKRSPINDGNFCS
jgi:hypothetical protein